jgi:hypothetical protein
VSTGGTVFSFSNIFNIYKGFHNPCGSRCRFVARAGSPTLLSSAAPIDTTDAYDKSMIPVSLLFSGAFLIMTTYFLRSKQKVESQDSDVTFNF